jgi:hypothetical protein
MAEVELKQGSNGDEPEAESQEQLQTAFKNLSELADGGASMVTMSKQDLSLMKQILTAVSEEYKEQIMWRMCDFVDEDEALDHVAAYFEAKDLGMDTDFNVAFMFALVSANRKTNKSNLISQILDAMQHGKWTPYFKKGQSNGHNPRSPLD